MAPLAARRSEHRRRDHDRRGGLRHLRGARLAVPDLGRAGHGAPAAPRPGRAARGSAERPARGEGRGGRAGGAAGGQASPGGQMSIVEAAPRAPAHSELEVEGVSNRFLYVLVFVVGMASLGAEIAAARLMSPYFGPSPMLWANTLPWL